MAGEEKFFTLTWKLENVEYSIKKSGEFIRSPSFVVDSIGPCQWYLALYPRGLQLEDYIDISLYRGDKCGPPPVIIKFELALIADDGSALAYTDELRCDFPKIVAYGRKIFESRKNVFATKRSAFLPRDTLTVRCRIWKSVGDMAEDVQCFARTRVGVQKRSFLWKVKKFSTLRPGEKRTYEIRSLDRDKQIISINLRLSEGLGSKEMICFELSQQDKAIKFSALRLYLVDASGKRVECNRNEFWFEHGSQTKEFEFLFTKDKLTEMKSSYLPDDILSLNWEWAFSKGVISNEIEDVQNTCTSSACKSSSTQDLNNQMMVPSSHSLNDNLKSLYDENFLCDVKLKTTNRVFPAHKIILSASSSVFKAMFSTEIKEKDSNCVNIDDFSDNTISRMLHFIYTTRMDDLTMESAPHLYAIADKYAILGLRNKCSSYMKDNLSPSNACEVLLLSDFHADGDLKSAVQNYILKNIKDIVTSDEWNILMETNAKLAAETVCLQYK